MKTIMNGSQGGVRPLLLIGCLLAGALPFGIAGTARAAEADRPQDISGLWQLRYDSLSVPTAALIAKAASEASVRREDMESRRWCRVAGMPALMVEAPLLDIRHGRRETVIVPLMQAMTRHLYTDGVQRMNPDDFDPASNGFTSARWEGDVLVAETTGFSDFGIRAIPGGGYRTENSRLVERFSLLDNGNRLSVVSTWTDAGVFARPHTYETRYYRVDPETFVAPQHCNVFETGREEFFAPALH